MMRWSQFGVPGFYDSPGYPGYDYYGYQPNYGGGRGFGQPLMKTVPNMHHEYGMPVEIPVIHEGSGASTTSEEESSKAKKPRIPESERPCSDKLPKDEVQTKKQASPNLHQKKPLSKPYGVRQVSVSDMESPEEAHDDEYPFFYPQASSEMYEDGFPFSNGFPFMVSPRRSPFTNVAANKANCQKTSAKAASRTVNKPDEKSMPKKTNAATEPRATAAQQFHNKVRQVPIVMENAQQHTAVPPAKKPLTLTQQLANIQKEMEAIESRVDSFSGEKKDKEYIVLDEMMTSLLLKLDMIESNGVEEIRNKRRQLVRHIQECVQKLEHKVGIVGPAEETESDEATVMEAGDAEMESKEDDCSAVTDQAMESLQGTAEEQTRVMDVDADKAPAAEESSHHDDDQVERLEDEMQTKVDETASSLQEMVVECAQTESNCTSRTEIDPEVANRTAEQMTEAGDANRTTNVEKAADTKQMEEDANRTTSVEVTTDTKQAEETMEIISSESEIARSSENCDVANEKCLSDEQDYGARGLCTDHSSTTSDPS